MRLGIDASNIRAGGGITYLRELLDAADPRSQGIDEVYVWSGERTLASLPKKAWLHPIHDSALDGGLLRRSDWRLRSLTKGLEKSGSDVLFAPGGVYTGSFRPFVAVSHNLLPFEGRERQRYGRSLTRARVELVRRLQLRTFAAADGLIFTADTAKRLIEVQANIRSAVVEVIPSGVDQGFRQEPREQEPLSAYSIERPFKWLYVSSVDVYKHQWNVVAAVATLRREGLPVALDLVGGGYSPAQRRLRASIAKWDPRGEFVRYLGPVPHADVAGYYHEADGAVFASSCDNVSFIILESMAAGLPIACARRSAMPEVLGDAGQYFDPEDSDSIADAMRSMLESPVLRMELATRAFKRVHEYTWARSAHETMRLISVVGRTSAGLGG